MNLLRPIGFLAKAVAAGGLVALIMAAEPKPQPTVADVKASNLAGAPGTPIALDLGANATQDRMRKNLFYLAAPEGEGRGPLTKGLDRAADYIAAQFKELGLKPLGKDGSYFQPFTTRGANYNGPNSLEFKLPNGSTTSFTFDSKTTSEDATLVALSASGKASGPLVFAGYGIAAPADKEDGYDDYKNLNVSKKIVLVLRDAPRANRTDDGFETPAKRRNAASLNDKLATALKKEAAAVIFVNDRVGAKEKDTLPGFAHFATNPFSAKMPVFMISRKLANKLMTEGGLGTLEEKEDAIDKDLKPQSGELKGVTVSAEVHVKRGADAIPLKNVVGVLEGSGPLADEAVVIGAHYDHVGSGGFGSLGSQSRAVLTHFGADDNGSGTTAVLELARRYAAKKDRQGRKLIFMTFSGEELGLYGSIYYCKNPLFPLDKTVAMVNLDMVGRLRPDAATKKDRLLVQGSGTAESFEALLDHLNKPYDFLTVRQKSGRGPSDHSSFADVNKPVLFFWTDVHDDYHRPTDTPDRINYAGMEKIVRFSSEVIDELSTNPEKPKYVQVTVPRATGPGRGAGTPALGIKPAYAEEDKGVKIESVADDKPAKKAGIKAGDTIVKLGDKEVKNIEVYMEIMGTKKSGETIKVGIIRDGKPINIDVKLD